MAKELRAPNLLLQQQQQYKGQVIDLTNNKTAVNMVCSNVICQLCNVVIEYWSSYLEFCSNLQIVQPFTICLSFTL